MRPEVPVGASFDSREVVFIRKARLLAGQALYYLYNAAEVLSSDGKEEDRRGYVAFALAQAAALINGVHISRAYLREGPQHEAAPAHVAFWRDKIWEPLNALCRSPDPGRTPAHQLEELASDLDHFLDATVPAPGWGHVGHTMRHVERWLRRRLTAILGVALFTALLVGVAPVSSLMFNQGPRVMLPIFAALSPVLLHYLLARRLGLEWGLRAFQPTSVLEPERSLPRWPARSPFAYFTVRAFAYDFLVVWVGGLSLAGFVVWLVGRLQQIPGGTSYLTVFLSFALIALALRVLRFFDRWDFVDERAIRALAVGAGVLAAVLIFRDDYLLLAIALLACGLSIGWKVGRNGGPVLLLVGIGIVTLYTTMSAGRSWLGYDATIWRNPERAPATPLRIAATDWPFPGDRGPVVLIAASGGGSRAAIYTAKTLAALHADYPHVAERINAISSVSGGSLASAAYIARRFEGKRDLGDLVKAMQGDFLLPTLAGALLPIDSRGQALERDWTTKGPGRPSLGALTIGSLSAKWTADARRASGAPTLPPFPLPLFNTCTLDSHDVVISPLPRWVYTKAASDNLRALRDQHQFGPADEPTWVVDRDGIYGLEDLLDKADPTLGEAVRASANFPFGFPPVRISTTDDRLVLSPSFRHFGEKDAKATAAGSLPPADVELTDGGVLSNSGLWSLYQLMTDQSKLDPSAPDGTPLNTIVERLRERGVLLIVVEASMMPEFTPDHRSLRTLFGALVDKNPVAQSLHRQMFQVLRDRYAARIAIVQVDLIAKKALESFNVHTTWALDPRSNGKLNDSFDTTWRRVGPVIADKFDKLNTHREPGPDLILRPPLD